MAALPATTEVVIEDIEDVEDNGRLALIGQGLAEVPAGLVDPACTTLDLTGAPPLPCFIRTSPTCSIVCATHTENNIQSGQILDRFGSLQALILDKNHLHAFPPDFPVLGTVMTLWINNNEVCILSRNNLE
jgi:hypothetical protein